MYSILVQENKNTSILVPVCKQVKDKDTHTREATSTGSYGTAQISITILGARAGLCEASDLAAPGWAGLHSEEKHSSATADRQTHTRPTLLRPHKHNALSLDSQCSSQGSSRLIGRTENIQPVLCLLIILYEVIVLPS